LHIFSSQSSTTEFAHSLATANSQFQLTLLARWRISDIPNGRESTCHVRAATEGAMAPSIAQVKGPFGQRKLERGRLGETSRRRSKRSQARVTVGGAS